MDEQEAIYLSQTEDENDASSYGNDFLATSDDSEYETTYDEEEDLESVNTGSYIRPPLLSQDYEPSDDDIYETTDNDDTDKDSIGQTTFVPPAPPGLPPDLQLQKEENQHTILEGIKIKEDKKQSEKVKVDKPFIVSPKSPNEGFRKKLESLLSGKYGFTSDDDKTVRKQEIESTPEANERFKNAKQNLAGFLQQTMAKRKPIVGPPPTSPPVEVPVSHYFEQNEESVEEEVQELPTSQPYQNKAIVTPPDEIPPFYFQYQYPPLLEEQDLIRHCSLSQQVQHKVNKIRNFDKRTSSDITELKLKAIDVCRKIYFGPNTRNTSTIKVLEATFLKFLESNHSFKWNVSKDIFNNSVIPIIGYHIMKFDIESLRKLTLSELRIPIENFIDTLNFLTSDIIQNLLMFDKRFLFEMLGTLKVKKLKESFTLDFVLFLEGLIEFYDTIFFQNIENTVVCIESAMSVSLNKVQIIRFLNNFTKFPVNQSVTKYSFVAHLKKYQDYFDNLNKISGHLRHNNMNLVRHDTSPIDIKDLEDLDFSLQTYISNLVANNLSLLEILYLSVKRIAVQRFIIPRLTTKYNIKDEQPIYFHRVLQWFQTVVESSYFEKDLINLTLNNIFVLKNGLYVLIVLNYFLGDLVNIDLNTVPLIVHTNSSLLRLGLPAIMQSECSLGCFYLMGLIYERFKNVPPSIKRATKTEWKSAYQCYLTEVHVDINNYEEEKIQQGTNNFVENISLEEDVPLVHRRPPPPPSLLPDTLTAFTDYLPNDTVDLIEEKSESQDFTNPFIKFPSLNLLRKGECNKFYFRLVDNKQLIWSVSKPNENRKYSRSRDVGRIDLSAVSKVQLMTNRMGLKDQAFIAFYIESKPFSPICGIFSLDGERKTTESLYHALKRIPTLKQC